MTRDFSNQALLTEQLTEERIVANLRPRWSTDNLELWYMGSDEDVNVIILDDIATLRQIWLRHSDYANRIRDIFVAIDNWATSVYGMNANPMEYIHTPLCPWWDYCTKSCFDYLPSVTEIVLLDPAKRKEFIDLKRQYDTQPNILKRLVLKTKDISTPWFYMELVRRDIWLILSDLQPHLIEKHGFFQGKETPYRIDPERSRRFLWL